MGFDWIAMTSPLAATSVPGLGLLWSGLQVALGLGLVIFVHELGHFLVAKACGVKCEKFYVGFDFFDLRFFRFTWGETEYGLGVFPLGGYVKMLGQDDDPRNHERERQRILAAQEEQQGHPVEDPRGSLDPAPSAKPDEPTGDIEAESEAPTLDPRSYPAKSVWQRMAIISAGVIFNVIFAIFLGAGGYLLGVPYTPTLIGYTAPGSPAWQENLQPGDKIIALGNGGEDENLRFTSDLLETVMFAGFDDQPVQIKLRGADGETRDIEFKPAEVAPNRYGIGVGGMLSLTLVDEEPVEKDSPAAEAELKSGDTLVALKLPGEQEPIEIDSFPAFQQQLVAHIDQPLIHIFERDGKRVEVKLAAEREVSLGLKLGMGPITAVRKDSPASKAKDAESGEPWPLKPGDILVGIGDEALDDPMLVEDRLRAVWGQEISLKVKRPKNGGEGSEMTEQVVTVTPETPIQPNRYILPGSPAAAQSIGVAFAVQPVVVGKHDFTPSTGDEEKQGGADLADIPEGSSLLRVEFKGRDEEAKKWLAEHYRSSKPLAVEEYGWPHIHRFIQSLPADIDVIVEYEVAGDTRIAKASIEPRPLEQAYHFDRGLNFAAKVETHYADGPLDALALGARETGESLGKVVTFLQKLVFNRVPFEAVGGPLTIVRAASSEASEGTGRLLIFLTLLSANLAVVNILPIPALDGGHLMFLTIEAIQGRPVDEKLQMTLTVFGIVGLLSLMLLVLSMDVLKLAFFGG